MKRLIYITLLLLCITPNLKSQSYIKSIEHGVYTNHNFSYPFTQMGVCTNHGLYLEFGMLDLPTEINFRFNQTIQQRSGRLSWMVPNLDEFAGYSGKVRYKEFYYSIGYSKQIKRYRVIAQCGYIQSLPFGKISNYLRMIDADNSFLDLGLHFQFDSKYQFIFIGYSWGVDFN